MSSSTTPRRPIRGRTLVGLLVVALAIVGLYSAGWFYLARGLGYGVGRQIADLAAHGVEARCENRTVDGYPFDLGLHCKSVAWNRRSDGISLAAGAFRSAAPIYNPGSVVGRVESPALVEVPGLPPLQIGWRDLTTGARLAAPLPTMLSLSGEDIRIAGRQEAAASQELAVIGKSRTVITRTGDMLDMSLSFEGLEAKAELPTAGRLPTLDGAAQIRFTDGLRLLDPRLGSPRARLRGRSGEIRSAMLSTARADISIAGPFAISDNGLVDATLRVTVHNPGELMNAFREAVPGYAEQISAVASLLGGMSNAGRLSIQLDIRRGRVFAGFLPLGVIPAL